MQLNFRPYIPFVSASVAYGAGYYISNSHVTAGLMSAAVMVNTVIINARKFDLLDKYGKERMCKEGAWETAQICMVAVVLSICLENLSTTQAVYLLGLSLLFIFFLIEYQDFLITKSNLNFMKDGHMKDVKKMIEDINRLPLDPKTRAFQLDFLNGVEKELDNLVNLTPDSGSEKYLELCSRVLSMKAWIAKKQGSPSA